jgi:hypothetical protein
LQVRKCFLEQNSYSCFIYRYEIHVRLILSFWFNVLWSFISVAFFAMPAVQTSVKSPLSVGYVNSQQISGQLFITPKYCFVMATLLMSSSLMWSHPLLTVQLIREQQCFLILVPVGNLSYMGPWMSREHLSMRWGSVMSSSWHQTRLVGLHAVVLIY